MPSNLPPINFDKEIKRLKKHDINVYSDKKNIKLKNCKHKQAKIVGNELRCSCGACWSGPNIESLLEYFKKQ